MAQIEFTENGFTWMEGVKCAECHTVFSAQQDVLTKCKQEGAGFYCPQGHKLWFGKSETEQLKGELLAVRKELSVALRYKTVMFAEKARLNEEYQILLREKKTVEREYKHYRKVMKEKFDRLAKEQSNVQR